MTQFLSANDASIEKAALVLSEGELVAIPTETVYGLAADARNGRAVAKVFDVKGRPSFNPLIVHVYDLEQAMSLANFTARELQLAQSFWPGALTMILPRKNNSGLSDLVSGGLDSVALRMPAHKTARKLLKLCGFPLAAPSANASGSLSPTSPAHVLASLGDKIGYILADGACEVGLESTVIDCSADVPVILRPGLITAQDIADVLGQDVIYDFGAKEEKDAPKSPGQLLKHYAPDIPVRLNAVDVEEGEALLAFGSIKFMAVRGKGAAKDLAGDSLKNLSEEGDLYAAAANLFSMLRALDMPTHKAIAVMNIPDNGIGIAINDRLKRAAAI